MKYNREREFYNLCQLYRFADINDQKWVTERFNALIEFVDTSVSHQRERDALVAEKHSKNCASCGCDGLQIAENIRKPTT